MLHKKIRLRLYDPESFEEEPPLDEDFFPGYVNEEDYLDEISDS